MLIKAGERDVGSSYIPHIDIMVQQQRAVGNVVTTTGAPLDAAHRGDGLHSIQQLCWLPADIPHLHSTNVKLKLFTVIRAI